MLNSVSDVSTAALERMLNTELIESEESERQRLMGLSKDELIERYLVAKVIDPDILKVSTDMVPIKG